MNTSPFVKIFSDKVYKTGKKFPWAVWDQDLDGLLIHFNKLYTKYFVNSSCHFKLKLHIYKFVTNINIYSRNANPHIQYWYFISKPSERSEGYGFFHQIVFYSLFEYLNYIFISICNI